MGLLGAQGATKRGISLKWGEGGWVGGAGRGGGCKINRTRISRSSDTKRPTGTETIVERERDRLGNGLQLGGE